MTVPDLVQDELRRQGVAGDDLLLCAISGGADSVSLSAAVHAAGYGRLHLAWVNHNLRSREEMRRDSEVVHSLGSHLGVPVLVEEIPEGLVRTHAHSSGQSIEQVARRFRYNALLRIATRLARETWSSPEDEAVSGRPTVYLLTAHHGDDQAETVLSRIADGHPATVPIATPVRRELADSPIRVILLRPALALEGRVLRQWGREHGFQWAEDATNQDVSFRRNALRYRVLPPLMETLPDSARMIARFGTGHDHLLAAMKALIPPAAYGRWTSTEWQVERALFRELPHAAQELVLRDAAYHVSSSDRVDAGFIGEVLRQLDRPATAGSVVRISGSDLLCVATAQSITVRRDIVPGGQRGYLFPVLPGS
ncbi:MAG TPA: tRNA lysidine(34) synthetase TilS, partial [Alkalispirochaeta sp.]|nr:tRNA lysidine(34) synthetase TilS [Alkalispirochaeta sp.]